MARLLHPILNQDGRKIIFVFSYIHRLKLYWDSLRVLQYSGQVKTGRDENKKIFRSLFECLIFSVSAPCQDLSEFRKEQLENIAARNDSQPNDDSYEMD